MQREFIKVESWKNSQSQRDDQEAVALGQGTARITGIEIIGGGALVQSEISIVEETTAAEAEVSVQAQMIMEVVEGARPGAGATLMTGARLPDGHLLVVEALPDAPMVNGHFPEVCHPKAVVHVP